MTKALPLTDFRSVRHILEPQDFALGGDEDDPPPSDQIKPVIWKGMMNLPDDVAVRISDHNGSRLELLYTLWSDWIEAVGHELLNVDLKPFDHPGVNTLIACARCRLS
ncbi:hypothetical protein [Bradyrhizobium genosp. P]|uniref:hypothetical protein n=1 Tax=Bradyrhizobium genosp. P TaxID=83641 RepID=UPI003CEEA404